MTKLKDNRARLALAQMALGLCLSTAQAQSRPWVDAPEDACFGVEYTPEHLAAHPERGVAALYVEFLPLVAFEQDAKEQYRHVRITARMGAQGQARRDQVSGRVLTATGVCRSPDFSCFTDGNRAWFDLSVISQAALEIVTQNYPVADYGGTTLASNLAEQVGQDTVYRLDRLKDGPCELE